MALIGDNQISQISIKGADWLCDRQGKTIIWPRSNEKDCIVKKSQIIALRFPIFINAIGLYGETIQTRFALLRKVQKSK